jgi:excisionase family DNA binding protein
MKNEPKDTTPKPISTLLTPSEAAKALHIGVNTLAVWRSTQRVTLRFVRIGRKILYRAEDVQAFIEERSGVETTHCDQTWRAS